MSPLVVGLDLSMTATGVSDGMDTRTVKTAEVGDRRLISIVGAVSAATSGADLAVIEDLPTHARAAGITGMVHGAVRVNLLLMDVRYVTVPPATLKKFATGRGNAGKPEMAVALFKRFGLELGDDNQVDAFWLRAAGFQLLGAPLVSLPATQVDALKAVSR